MNNANMPKGRKWSSGLYSLSRPKFKKYLKYQASNILYMTTMLEALKTIKLKSPSENGQFLF
ncbi:hypothetical protein BT10792_32320 (plasmid) [Bacillus thuringiensis]|nr:hypothetical protein BT10792_32320 [Bacillus thuringiensis]